MNTEVRHALKMTALSAAATLAFFSAALAEPVPAITFTVPINATKLGSAVNNLIVVCNVYRSNGAGLGGKGLVVPVIGGKVQKTVTVTVTAPALEVAGKWKCDLALEHVIYPGVPEKTLTSVSGNFG